MEEINSDESKKYLVHLPDISYYDADNMTAENVMNSYFGMKKIGIALLIYSMNCYCTADQMWTYC